MPHNEPFLRKETVTEMKPLLQALVFADHVYVDKMTGKKIIAGTFNHLTADDFPADFGRSKYGFISLTEVKGKVDISLRFVSLSTQDVLLELGPIWVECKNPLDTVEVVVEVPDIPMPHAGVYAFEVLAGDEPLGSIRISISKRTPAPEEN